MQVDREMKAVIEGKRYDCATATLIASNAYWDGHNYERSGRNTWLFRTPKGRYFFQFRTCWQDEHDRLQTIGEDDAIDFFERMQEHDMCEMEFEQAFPGVKIEEA